jgi:hypothetical protein
MRFPSFDYRQWYQTEISTLEEIRTTFLNLETNNERYFRGMPNYDFICISTFYRNYITSKNLDWEETDVGFNSKVDLPKINLAEYSKLSFAILDDFYDNLLLQGSNELNLNVIAYLAQHYHGKIIIN